MIDFFKRTFQDRFKRYLLISLIALGVVLIFANQQAAKPIASETFKVHFFYLPTCPHCKAQEPFNEKLASKYPSVQFIYHDATKPEEQSLLTKMLLDLGIKQEPGFPITIFQNQVFSGWESEETTGAAIEGALEKCLAGNCPQPANVKPRDEITLPFIGVIKASEYSLPALAVILGAVDGFNPCAMWVLVYLISLIATLRDRKRIWLLVGSFLLASGILYLLFMTAWLNAFLFLGYVRPVTIVIGLVALGGGILQIKEFATTRGAIVCEVTDQESRKKTMTRIQEIVASPITLGTIAGVVALAFVVNSIEFVCSAAIPAVFTHVLSLHPLPVWQYYGYIVLYVFVFMLDDMVVFGSAAVAMTSNLGDRYAKYSRPVGGTILMLLGGLLLFAPNLLR